jgi:hypothetical protein
MNTNTPSIDLNAFLELYLDPTQTAATIARALSSTIPEVLRFSRLPETTQAIELLEAFNDRRHTIVAGAPVQRVLRDLYNLPALPANPTPAESDRRRRDLDSARRAAEFLRKLYLPAPTPAARKSTAANDANTSPPVPTLPPLSARKTPANNLRALAGCA